MEFYSVHLRKKVDIPKSKLRLVTKKGRKFVVGKYKVKGDWKEAWRIVGKDYKL